MGLTLPVWFANGEPGSRDDDRASAGRLASNESGRASGRTQPTLASIASTDAARIAAIRAGDLAQFTAWYAEWFTPLWRFAYRYVWAREAAEDIVQDVFATIWAQRTSFTPTTTLQAYLFSAVRNRALKVLRHHRVVDAATPALTTEMVSHAQHATTSIPETAVHRDEIRRAVFEAIATLPERQRDVLWLRVARDMTLAEIAQVLGISVAAVGKLALKGETKLQELLRRFAGG